MWTSKLHVDPAHVAEADENEFAKYVSVSSSSPFLVLPSDELTTRCALRDAAYSAFARIENHYFVNDVRSLSPMAALLLSD